MVISHVPRAPPTLISCIPKSPVTTVRGGKREKKNCDKGGKLPLCKYEIIISPKKQGKAARLREDGQTNGLVLSRAGTVEDEEDSDSNCLAIARIAAN